MATETFLKINEKALPGEVERVIHELGIKILDESQKNLATSGSIDRGTLLKSGKIIFRPLESEITYPVPWAVSIEYGRTPGSMPPVASIEGWVKRKLSVKDPKSVAWAIAKKIKEEGTQAKPFLRPAIEKVKREFS